MLLTSILKWIRELWIGELSNSNIFHIAGVLVVLESSLIELESSLIQLQSSANELVVPSLIAHI